MCLGTGNDSRCAYLLFYRRIYASYRAIQGLFSSPFYASDSGRTKVVQRMTDRLTPQASVLLGVYLLSDVILQASSFSR